MFLLTPKKPMLEIVGTAYKMHLRGIQAGSAVLLMYQ